MSTSANVPKVNFRSARAAILAAMDAGVPVMLLGDPGVGKTAIMASIATEIGKPLATLIGSTLDPTDVGGIPVVVDGRVVRVPLAVVRECCDNPRLFFLDEASTAPPVVQAALLRVLLERVAGDSRLHAETVTALAANPPEQAPGGFEMSAPLMGRVATFWFRPDEMEVLEYFKGLGDESSPLRLESMDFALTCEHEPRLLQIDIPPDCVQGNAPWGAPRAWERVVRCRAAAAARGLGEDATFALMAGSVGQQCATTYSAILKLRHNLPSIPEIVADPGKATMPQDKRLQIAAVGLIPRVADQNSWAAWIYAERLQPEFGVACMHVLLKHKSSSMTAAHAKEGVKARQKMAGSLMQRFTDKAGA